MSVEPMAGGASGPRKFKFQLLAEPGTQSLCQILGIVALYDPRVISGAIGLKPQGHMFVQLKLTFIEPQRALLLLARLRNLVGVRRAAIVPLA